MSMAAEYVLSQIRRAGVQRGSVPANQCLSIRCVLGSCLTEGKGAQTNSMRTHSGTHKTKPSGNTLRHMAQR